MKESCCVEQRKAVRNEDIKKNLKFSRASARYVARCFNPNGETLNYQADL